jgi:hypothetical protein
MTKGGGSLGKTTELVESAMAGLAHFSRARQRRPKNEKGENSVSPFLTGIERALGSHQITSWQERQLSFLLSFRLS